MDITIEMIYSSLTLNSSSIDQRKV